MLRVHQPVEHRVVRRADWNRGLIGGVPTGHGAPIRAQTRSQRVCLRLQEPTGVILRPGQLKLVVADRQTQVGGNR